MRVGGMSPVPMIRRPIVAAGGGETPATAPAYGAPTPPPGVAAAPASAPVISSATASVPASSGALMKVQSFFMNIWDTVIGPALKGLLGLFGLG